MTLAVLSKETKLEPESPTEYVEPLWYAAYTSANHEKRVAEQLNVRSVQHFLPTYESVRQWKDRKRKLRFPLFPGYVFVRITLHDRLRVVQIPGVARLVGFGGMPTALPQEDMDRLKSALVDGVRAEPHPYLTVGRRARIKHGPLVGLEGVLTRIKGNWRVVLSLDLIQRSISVDVDVSSLEPAMN